MRKISLLLLFLFSTLIFTGFSQGNKNGDKATLGKTYSYGSVYAGLRNMIDKPNKSNYFSDDFFNDLLKKILQDPKFSDKEKIQLFYLMQKKIGYAFSGISYLPPQQNYFTNHTGKVYTYQKTQVSLKGLNYNPAAFLKIAETYRTSDALLSANALLLASLINPDSAVKKLQFFTKGNVIKEAKNGAIFNHYACLSAALAQDSIVVKNLTKNLNTFTSKEWIEDVLCALYAKSNPLSLIKQYIINEKNERNGLAIQTALCVLAGKIPEPSFERSLQGIEKSVNEKWKKDILNNVLAKKYLFDYSLASNDKVTTKVWEGFTVQVYNDGVLITNGIFTEFDEN